VYIFYAINTLILFSKKVSIEKRILISKLMESTRYKRTSTHNKGDNSDSYGKYPEINLLRDRSVNKIITGAHVTRLNDNRDI